MMALTFNRIARSRKRRAKLLVVSASLIGGVGVAVVLAVFPDSHAHALNAAGAFKGTPIPEVQTFVDKLKGSLVWLGITLAGLVIAVIALMFLAGHSRAHDLAIKTGVGLMILASISGIVA